MKTWKIVEWKDRPDKTTLESLCCPNCETDAEIPIGETPGGLVIAAIGINLIFDPPGYKPPKNFMPDTVRCRTCRKTFVSEESNVR